MVIRGAGAYDWVCEVVCHLPAPLKKTKNSVKSNMVGTFGTAKAIKLVCLAES